MPDTEKYEIVVLGSGEAGRFFAWTMARAGHRTALIDRGSLGGARPNVACLSSKNLIYSAKVASLIGRGAEFGVFADSVQSRKRNHYRVEQPSVRTDRGKARRGASLEGKIAD